MEAREEALQRFVQHGVHANRVGEFFVLALGRQFAVEQQVADFHVVGLLRQLIGTVAAVQQLALLAIDKGDGRLAGAGRGKARIKGKPAGVRIQLAHIDRRRAHRALNLREFNGTAVGAGDCIRIATHARLAPSRSRGRG